MHTLIIFLLQVFANEKFRTWAAETLQHFIEKLLRSEVKKRKRKAARKSKRKKKKMTDPNHVHAIQEHLRSLVKNPDAAILEQAGVFAEINLEEKGLNKAEGSFGGITPRTWNEYLKQNPHITVVSPAEFETMPANEVAQHLYNFKTWYFQKPPKRDFFALPSLLWLVACDAAFLADVPVISRIQKLVGCKTVDGIWGSGTTAQVKSYFTGKTVPDMVQFAQDLTALVIERYEEMRQYPQYAESVPHWIERAERKIQQLLDFVNQQNALADAGNNVETMTREAIVNELPVNELRQPRQLDTDATTPESPNGEGSDQAERATEEADEAGKQTEPETVTVPVEDLKVLTTAVHELTETVNHQSKVIIDFKDALLEHVEAQKEMLDRLLNTQQETDEGASGKPLSPREGLNEVPDSLVP